MIEYVNVKLYAACRFKDSASATYTSYYTEEGLHRPLFSNSAKIYVPDSAELIYNAPIASPRKGHEFDEIEVAFDYNRLNGLSYHDKVPRFITIETKATGGSAKNCLICGWIDDIEPVAVKGPSSNSRIKWHVDYWLTEEYFKQIYNYYTITQGRTPISYGCGRIKRGPQGLARPGSMIPRMWMQQAAKNLMSSEVAQKIPWVIISYAETDPNTHYTTITYLNWQPGVTIPDGGNTYNTLTWDDVYGGLIEEKLGLDPRAVIGAWVAPMPASLSSIYTHTTGGVTYAAYEYFNSGSTVTATFDLNNHVWTDDIIKWVFEDTTGTEMFTAPWGLQFRYIIEQIDVGSSGANVMFYLATKSDYDSTGGDMSKLNYASEGRLFSFPLPALPVTENAWASYNYSGERAYDIQMREIQRNQNAVNGIAGVGTSAIGGAVAGSMVAPGPGTVAGAVGGAVSALIGTEASFISSLHYDQKSQEAVDKLTSSQTAGMIVTARGRRGIEPFGKHGETFGWCVVKMQADYISAADIYNDQSELGYITDAYRTDCSSFIALGGGLRIEGLEVKGDINAKGRREISALFARGVHLDIIT